VTGIRVRETIPDALLDQADDVLIVDLTPEELLERLRLGKVYPQDRIEAALNNFFRIENLSALREVALRQVAEEVGHRRLASVESLGARDGTIASEAPRAVGERLLALVEPYPGGQRLVRRAWRSAQSLGAELDLLWVRPPAKALSDDDERSLQALRQLASVLGIRLLIEESDDVAATVADVARRQGTTYILMGSSHPARGVVRLRTPLPQRLMELLPGVDVRIVADRAYRPTADDHDR
jgi:two-component system, OmpR family, sensor histidine kinase KdpD